MITPSFVALIPFLPKFQCFVIAENLEGEEREFFTQKDDEIQRIIDEMPVTYQQEGLGDQAIVYLHYFFGNCHWFITEKDIEGDGTIHAFGMADLGYGPEYGYISILEIVQSSIAIELDIFWEPKTRAEVMQQHYNQPTGDSIPVGVASPL